MGNSPQGGGKQGKDANAEPAVEIHDAQGFLVGDNGRQTNFFTNVNPPQPYDPARRAKNAPPGEVESPYRGLGSFREQDAAFFFGREAAADEILRRLLAARAYAPALLMVSGVSGVPLISTDAATLRPLSAHDHGDVAGGGHVAAPGGPLAQYPSARSSLQ